MEALEKQKIAVILFNLGGPDKPESVQPFLFNLFNDKAIIGLPQPLRFLLAKLISSRRAPVAQEIYTHIGGKSPLLEETTQQAEALEKLLNKPGDTDWKAFICMRYWHPMTEEVVQQVKAYQPDRIILLPLYPQFSTTTSGSSLALWQQEASRNGLDSIPVTTLCCYPTQPDFIRAHAALLQEALARQESPADLRILFSAHGLPKKIIAGGDPYQWQVEQTASAVMQQLEGENSQKYDWQVCYQSRVGPLEWIGPSTEDEISRAGSDGKGIILVPIAFVSEHSETLVELDIEYKELADERDVPAYIRVPALTAQPDFIGALADMCRDAVSREAGYCAPDSGSRICPEEWSRCPCSG